IILFMSMDMSRLPVLGCVERSRLRDSVRSLRPAALRPLRERTSSPMRGPSSVVGRSVGLIGLPGDPKQPVLWKRLPFEAPAALRLECRDDLVWGDDPCGERKDVGEEQPGSE